MPENFMMIKFPSRGGYTSLTLNFQNMFASVIYFSGLILMYFLGQVFLRSYLHEGCVGRVMLRLRAGKELMDRRAWGLKDWAGSDLLGKSSIGCCCGESNTPVWFGCQGTSFRSQVLPNNQERLFIFMEMWEYKLGGDSTWAKWR